MLAQRFPKVPPPVLRMKVNEELLTNSKQLDVSTRGALKRIHRYKFGEYELVNSRAGVTRQFPGQQLFPWLVQIELIKTSGIQRWNLMYEFTKSGAAGVMAYAFVQKIKQESQNILLGFSSIDVYDERWGVEYRSAAWQKPWVLQLILRYDRKTPYWYSFSGLLEDGDQKIEIIPVREFSEKFSEPQPDRQSKKNIPVSFVGYEFVLNGKVVAAVQSHLYNSLLMNDRPVSMLKLADYWEEVVLLGNDLEESVELAIAAAVPALLQISRNTLEEIN
ncbi:MAG: hypothetical protein KatS3mg032_1191 [Cyclobacteriaceae bacterium]|nr:MAG: hypothetical protein KatS3mg032_1191 [Cyclobacteriaceae bacterium]